MFTTLLWLLLTVPQTKLAPEVPKLRVSCILTNHQFILSHYNNATGKLDEHDEDDWTVECSIAKKDTTLFKQVLPLARPTNYHDAMDAVNEWRTKRAPEIIKEQKLK